VSVSARSASHVRAASKRSPGTSSREVVERVGCRRWRPARARRCRPGRRSVVAPLDGEAERSARRRPRRPSRRAAATASSARAIRTRHRPEATSKRSLSARLKAPWRRSGNGRAATLDHNAELWAHIEPESSRLLLLSALDAFLARGFHAATTREIAERAGMSPAAVYVHWTAKHDLLFEISRIGHQAVLDVVEQALERGSGDPVERVHAFVSAFATLARGEPRAGRVIQYEFKKLPSSQFRRSWRSAIASRS
jgi:hypothetical protein